MLDTSLSKFKTAIRELTSVGRIESEMLGKQTNVDIGELLADIKLSIVDKITTSGTTIIENLEVQEIQFSKKNLRSILYNLISNAIKFSSPNRRPEITISTRALDEFVQLSVSDNGIGMAEDKITSVFAMYSRLNMHI
jgi:two-component system CheB/CheR fusion protein